MDRRLFLKLGLAGTAASMIPLDGLAASGDDNEYLTILHTNDVHSRVEPFPSTDPKYAGKGGVARRKSMIDEIRRTTPNILLFDSGDIFQGTPYFNLYGGEVELKAMSAMQYDAATMGNHDFDNGVEGFVKMMPHAAFPFICSNYDFSATALAGKTHKFHVFRKGKIKIGVIGLGIELSGLVADSLAGNTVYLDPIAVADEYGQKLKEAHGCHLVVCLSHLGYRYDTDKVSDMVLAQNTSYIDVILGGHTHTFLDAPEIVKNKLNKDVIVNQVGWGGIRLGSISFVFQKNTKSIRNNRDISYIAGVNQEIS